MGMRATAGARWLPLLLRSDFGGLGIGCLEAEVGGGGGGGDRRVGDEGGERRAVEPAIMSCFMLTKLKLMTTRSMKEWEEDLGDKIVNRNLNGVFL